MWLGDIEKTKISISVIYGFIMHHSNTQWLHCICHDAVHWLASGGQFCSMWPCDIRWDCSPLGAPHGWNTQDGTLTCLGPLWGRLEDWAPVSCWNGRAPFSIQSTWPVISPCDLSSRQPDFLHGSSGLFSSSQKAQKQNLSITVYPWITQGLECQPPTQSKICI